MNEFVKSRVAKYYWQGDSPSQVSDVILPNTRSCSVFCLGTLIRQGPRSPGQAV